MILTQELHEYCSMGLIQYTYTYIFTYLLNLYLSYGKRQRSAINEYTSQEHYTVKHRVQNTLSVV